MKERKVELTEREREKAQRITDERDKKNWPLYISLDEKERRK